MDLQKLLEESLLLIQKKELEKENFNDYSFLVFPAAKAYEGFLKKIFLDLGFISENDYYGERFRIGKALNPYLEPNFRMESVYDKLVEYTGDEDLAAKLWQTWKESRNLLFHWFPNNKNTLTFAEAVERVNMILSAIEVTFKECKMSVK